MYTDNTILTYGKYKFNRLGDISFEYLLRVFKDKSIKDEQLLAYIKRKIDGEKIQKANEAQLCDKLYYCSKKVAKEHLKIIAKQKNKNGIKKPIRAYECPKCSGWHLTSLTLEEYALMMEK